MGFQTTTFLLPWVKLDINTLKQHILLHLKEIPKPQRTY